MNNSILTLKENDYIIAQDCPEIKLHSNTQYCPLIYELIPAHGCSFECAYCNVYSLKEEKTYYPITVFERYPDLLRETIGRHKAMGEKPVYYFSPKTDAFQDALIKTQITHKILQVLLEEQVPYILVTKGKLPDDKVLGLLKESRRFGRVLVSYGMKNEFHAKILEPYAATLDERLELATVCTKNEIPVMGIIEPILPLDDLSFVRNNFIKFVDIGVNHFAIDFARISRICLEGLIQKLPELGELRKIYYAEDAISQNFQTGAYYRESTERYAPSQQYHIENFNLIKEYAEGLGATVSKCNYFMIPGLNDNAYKKGFLCFGIYDPDRANEFLARSVKGQI